MFNWTRSKPKNKDEQADIRPTMKIEDFPKMFSGKMIEIILQEEKESGNEYLGGDFNIVYLDDDHYYCSYELCFIDDKGDVYKSSSKSKPLSNVSLLLEARKELAEEKLITFEIPEPSKAERDVYSGDISLKNTLKDIFDIFQPKK